MLSKLKWVRTVYQKAINSIAFIPAFTASIFLVISFILIELDFSETGKAIKSTEKWLRLKDADTARSIISTIVGGVISLTVFSFSMVMILLSQVASHMSNRVLDKLIGNRFQQTVLGFYIGTIVYALFLLSTISDIDAGVNIPSISTYLLIVITIVDIFFFIYFLHYITRSVIYDTIIHNIHDNTNNEILKSCSLETSSDQPVLNNFTKSIKAYKSGIYQGFERKRLLELCMEECVTIKFLYPVGTFVLEETPLLVIIEEKVLTKDFEKNLSLVINIHRGQEIKTNYYYGFKQLMEIAVKALSPGINDPGTAVLCLHALGELLAFYLQNIPTTQVKDKNGVLRIICKERPFEDLLEESILPIWDYGKDDRLIQTEMHHLLTQLKARVDSPVIDSFLKMINNSRKDNYE